MMKPSPTWTFELEGAGVPDGYYTPREDWDSPASVARWLAAALWDFDAVTGDREAVTAQLRQQLSPLVAEVAGVCIWQEGTVTVSVLRLYPPFPDQSRMGPMESRRRVRAGQWQHTAQQATTN